MKTIQVREIYQLHGMTYITVSEDAALDYVVELLGHERNLQGVFMVDSNQRYVGMVSRLDLLKWVEFQLYGGNRRKEIKIGDIFQLVYAKKASDLESRNMRSFSVKESDTLQTALDLMIDYEETILPVIDIEGRIIGDLTLSEVLFKAFEIGKLSNS